MLLLSHSAARTIRGAAMALAAATALATLDAEPALATNGLVVRQLDGTVPVNQPDLFATALAKSWGNGTQFCSALKAAITNARTSGGPTLTSCQAATFGATSIGLSHGKAEVRFDARVTTQGMAPVPTIYNRNRQPIGSSCAFTDTIDVTLTDALIINKTMQKVDSVTFAPPAVSGKLESETWTAVVPAGYDTTCPQPPAGLGSAATIAIPVAASNVGFPGDSLNAALAPYGATVAGALSSTIYAVSDAGGDINLTVTSSSLHQLPREKLPVTQGSI